jgi:hypothetical protein
MTNGDSPWQEHNEQMWDFSGSSSSLLELGIVAWIFAGRADISNSDERLVSTDFSLIALSGESKTSEVVEN